VCQSLLGALNVCVVARAVSAALQAPNCVFGSSSTTTTTTLHAGLFMPSQLSSVQSEADMQRFAAPEQDCSSLDTLVQSASAASDIFMLGVLTYETLVGKHAFPVKDDGIGRARRWQVLHALRCLLTWMRHADTTPDLLHSCVWTQMSSFQSCDRGNWVESLHNTNLPGYILAYCLCSWLAASNILGWGPAWAKHN